MVEEPFDSHAARYWHKLDDGRIQCDLCLRFCRLHEGQRAFCFVRARQGDEIVLTTYGRSGFCSIRSRRRRSTIFLPGTPVLSFGTSGCNLGCKFCQNWGISKAREYECASPFSVGQTHFSPSPQFFDGNAARDAENTKIPRRQ